MISWNLQIQYFTQTFLLGILLGFFFHFYWILLQNTRPAKKLLTLTDILFSLFLLLFLTAALLFINAGEIRLYVWLALLLGAWLYKQWMKKIFRPILYVFCRSLLFITRFFLQVIDYPFRALFQRLHRSSQKDGESPASSDSPPSHPS